jgi:hypothetical protein
VAWLLRHPYNEIAGLRPASLDHCYELLFRHGPAESVTLHNVASNAASFLSIFAGFDADSDRIAIEIMGDLNHAFAEHSHCPD